jgi:drug/metabolite transporter (DMT)-like permease
MALRGGEADAAGFTAVRLTSGAVALIVISYFFSKGKTLNATRGNWISAAFLFAYAICFSFAYIGLTAAVGALILFSAVQFTMIAVALFRGERPHRLEWLGLLIAVAGLVYLVFPGLSSPPLLASVLMASAGIAWGFYTLRGKGSNDPLGDTAGNFIRSVPMIVLAAIPFFSRINLSTRGFVLAVLSGAVASGIGYTVWYIALKHHTATRAAVLQLSVPVIAAFGGVLLLSEVMTTRLLIASALILGGIAMTIFGRRA